MSELCIRCGKTKATHCMPEGICEKCYQEEFGGQPTGDHFSAAGDPPSKSERQLVYDLKELAKVETQLTALKARLAEAEEIIKEGLDYPYMAPYKRILLKNKAQAFLKATLEGKCT